MSERISFPEFDNNIWTTEEFNTENIAVVVHVQIEPALHVTSDRFLYWGGPFLVIPARTRTNEVDVPCID